MDMQESKADEMPHQSAGRYGRSGYDRADRGGLWNIISAGRGQRILQPEFEEKVIEGDVYIKGKITGIIFLIAGLKIALDKNIWRLIKLLKKEGV